MNLIRGSSSTPDFAITDFAKGFILKQVKIIVSI